jgi:hypothetical protein
MTTMNDREKDIYYEGIQEGSKQTLKDVLKIIDEYWAKKSNERFDETCSNLKAQIKKELGVGE